jgi:hypothetical protein
LFLIFVSHVRDRFLARFHTFASALVSFCEWVTSHIASAVLDSGARSYPGISRLARGMATFLGIVHHVNVRGASLGRQNSRSTRARGEAVLDMVGVFAEFRDGAAPRAP